MAANDGSRAGKRGDYYAADFCVKELSLRDVLGIVRKGFIGISSSSYKEMNALCAFH